MMGEVGGGGGAGWVNASLDAMLWGFRDTPAGTTLLKNWLENGALWRFYNLLTGI